MNIVESIKQYAENIPAEFKEKKGAGQITFTVAERKVFLSNQKLTYQAKFRVEEHEKVIRFSEALLESSAGMSLGGMGFSSGSYKTGKGGVQESVFEQQSRLFGKKYEYRFDFKTIREKIESLAKEAGYDFQYQITAKGI